MFKLMQGIVNYCKATLCDTCHVFCENTNRLKNVYKLIINVNIELHCKQGHTNWRRFVKCKPLI
jgi:Pyruvate/2-oxoacid:ferredoxin oxidoreductase delta subunit